MSENAGKGIRWGSVALGWLVAVVGAGGFLGIGEKQFMIPVEAVADVGKDGVTIEHGREKVAESPPFDTDVVPPTTAYQREVYGYYGYTPTWGPYGSGGV